MTTPTLESTVKSLLASGKGILAADESLRIVLLSGGQSDEVATQRLNDICKVGDVPWQLSFSFGRAVQSPAFKIWKGSPANVAAAQAALHQRAKCNGFAVQGKYSAQMENPKIGV